MTVQMADEERGALERRLRDETHRRMLKILQTGVHVTKVAGGAAVAIHPPEHATASLAHPHTHARTRALAQAHA